MEEARKKPPPPNHVNTGSHFAINFFRPDIAPHRIARLRGPGASETAKNFGHAKEETRRRWSLTVIFHCAKLWANESRGERERALLCGTDLEIERRCIYDKKNERLSPDDERLVGRANIINFVIFGNNTLVYDF